MGETDDLWPAIRRVLPDAEAMAAVVAAEVGEPIADVRPSVHIGTIALNGQLGPAAAVTAAIESELGRLETRKGTQKTARSFGVASLDELLAETRALEAKGSLDLETIVGIQRASGAIAARTDRPLDALLHRYAVTRRQIWEQCIAALQAGRLDASQLAEFGRFLLLWNELTSLAATDGYRTVERDILARAVESRRDALRQLLGVVADDAEGHARLRRVAVRHGLNPDQAYCLIAIAPHPESDPTPEQPGIGDEDLQLLAGRIGHLLGSTAPGAEGVGTEIRLPAVMPLLWRVAVLARADWAGLKRVPSVLDNVLGGLAHAGRAKGRTSKRAQDATSEAWVAIGSSPIDGVGSLAARYADLAQATRIAQRLGLRGWIPDPEHIALERLLLANPELADATMRRELGPLLADERFGSELIETLQAYFDAGENVTAAARRLHLATRTVAYRLEKIVSLLGHPIEGEYGRRLSAALMVYRLRSLD